jgi:DNA polymerase-3 subunit epsilon
MKQLFIDIETNQSLDPKTGVITQLAFIYRKNGKTIKSVNIKTNIYTTFVSELDKIVDRFDKNDKVYFIGYNAKFDSDFIRELFTKNNNKFYGSYFFNPIIDIMNIAAYKFMLKKSHPENFKLGTIAKFLNIEVDNNNLHDALYDIEISRKVYSKLLKY